MKKSVLTAAIIAAAMLAAGCSTSGSTGAAKAGGEQTTADQTTAAQAAGSESAGNASAGVVEFEWWHALESQYEPIVNRLVEEFNSTHDQIKVKPMYNGNYSALNEAIVAANAAGIGLPGLAMANIPYITGYGR